MFTKMKSLCGKPAPLAAPNEAHEQLAIDVADKIGGALLATIERPDGSSRVLISDNAEPLDPMSDATRAEAKRVRRCRIVTLDKDATKIEDVDIVGDPYADLFGAQQHIAASGWVEPKSEAHVALVAGCAFHDARSVLTYFPNIKSPMDMLPMMGGPEYAHRAGKETAGSLAALALMSGRFEVAAAMLKMNPGSKIDGEGLQRMLADMGKKRGKK